MSARVKFGIRGGDANELKTDTHRYIAMVVCLCMFPLAGCAPVAKDPILFNKALETQIPGQPATHQPLSCISVSGGSEACIRPGMKLVAIQTDARASNVQDRTIVESRTEWTIPTPESFSQEDLFHLSWLLSVSTSDRTYGGQTQDASQCYEAWVQSNYYPGKFTTAFVTPLLESLYVEFETGGTPGPYADDVKRWMHDLPPAGNPSAALPRQKVRFDLPLLPSNARVRDAAGNPPPSYCLAAKNRTHETYTALAGGSPFEREQTDYNNFNNAGGWYRAVPPGQHIVAARAYVSVLVTVSVENGAGIHYVPIYASLEAAAATLQRDCERLAGVWRDTQLVPPGLRERADPGARVYLRASDATDYDCGCGSIPVQREQFARMLVAPGDEFVFR
jgi:hypothetical protein